MAQSFAHGNYSHTQKNVRNGGGRTPRDRARRTLSQNFLVDPHAVGRLVKAARPSGLVLEPGSGEGVLTRALAPEVEQIIGYEIDPLLAGKLAARTRGDTRISVVRGDFTAARPPREPFAVVGNIPYSITSRIVDWCLAAPALTSATLLTQLEYARKRSGDFGRWSLVTVESWPWFSWELLGQVGRESFRPVPSVDSGILRIERRETPLLPPAAMAGFRAFAELGFGGVGGSLSASLRQRYAKDAVADAFRAAGLDGSTVVAFVHPDQWVTLYDRLG
ncbi:ErmE/ErmH/ErmO/ErmR family 23S rRNA (adenine(2058)-N(6))-methyltransferase [Nonomuraea sp. NPDC046570]|uniref:ErmE/ErmH/ErmO/ErmR family 23S rRNA (adenine(2058)-N(6))-methyltransferase n=1 Tax=Nonomuraea sp. NPDC046570 TaxID=3155255 RepID=UPI0033FCA0D0